MRTPTWDAAVLDAHRLVARAQRCQIYRFADGFDHYNTASQQYELVNGSVTYGTAYRRFAPPAGLPGQGIKFTSGTFSFVRKNLAANVATPIIKCSFYFGALGGAGTRGNPFLGVLDAGNNQWHLVLFQDGSIAILTGALLSGTIVARSGPGVVAAGSYSSFEIVCPIGSSVSAQVWCNGFQIIAASGINTQSTANSYCNQVQIGDMENTLASGILYADDFRVWDSTGSTQNAALGTDSRLATKMPSGAGSNTNLTPNGAAANWQCVDDNPPDDDTTYVSGASNGLVDSYAMPSAGFTAAPVMVVSRSRMRKDDGAVRSAQIGVQSGTGSNASGSATLASSYAFFDGCTPYDPNPLAAGYPSAPWTAAAADAAQHWKQETA